VNDVRALEAIRTAYREMGRLMDEIDWCLLDRCDCGHRRIEHLASQHHVTGQEPCCHRDCICPDFDTMHQRIEHRVNGRG
jgi:hypothetical protein